MPRARRIAECPTLEKWVGTHGEEMRGVTEEDFQRRLRAIRRLIARRLPPTPANDRATGSHSTNAQVATSRTATEVKGP